jgi:hypothetical protein
MAKQTKKKSAAERQCVSYSFDSHKTVTTYSDGSVEYGTPSKEEVRFSRLFGF